jgi:hypothetical protein
MSTTWERRVDGKWVLDHDQVREGFKRAEVVEGVLRWKSNGSVPPQDCLDAFVEAGLGSKFDMKVTSQTRRKEEDASLADYRRRMANHVPSDEEMFEMRAAFGPGTTVVNVLTGKETKL